MKSLLGLALELGVYSRTSEKDGFSDEAVHGSLTPLSIGIPMDLGCWSVIYYASGPSGPVNVSCLGGKCRRCRGGGLRVKIN